MITLNLFLEQSKEMRVYIKKRAACIYMNKFYEIKFETPTQPLALHSNLSASIF